MRESDLPSADRGQLGPAVNDAETLTQQGLPEAAATSANEPAPSLPKSEKRGESHGAPESKRLTRAARTLVAIESHGGHIEKDVLFFKLFGKPKTDAARKTKQRFNKTLKGLTGAGLINYDREREQISLATPETESQPPKRQRQHDDRD